MMKRSKFVILLLSLLPFVADAQTPLSIRQRRMLNFRALNAIEQYEVSQHLRDSESEYLFESVFEDRKKQIFCDLVDYKSCRMVPLSEYMVAVKRRSNIFMEIENLKRGEPIFKSGRWVLPVSFTKSVSYIDNNGLDFSTKSYYGSDYVISMELSYNEADDKCYISRMSGALKNSTVSPLPEHFTVVKRADKFNRKDAKFYEKLRYGKEPIKFNGAYAILGDPNKKVESWNHDVHIKQELLDRTDSYDLVRYKYRANHMRVKLRGAMAVGNVFNVKVCKDSNISTKSMGYEMGVDLGAAFFAGRSSQIGIYAGAAYTYTGLSLIYDSPLKYQLLVNNSNDNYGNQQNNVKEYNIVRAEESLNFKDITIPVYINFEHYLHKSLLLTWNLGAKIYINGQTEYTPLTITKSKDTLNGAELTTTIINNYLVPISYARSPIDFSVVGGIALNVNLFKNYIYTYAKFSYEYGLHSLFDGEYNFKYRKSLINNVTSADSMLQEFCNPNKNIYPVVYDGTRDMDVANRSMLNSVCFDRSTMWVEFGFMFKF